MTDQKMPDLMPDKIWAWKFVSEDERRNVWGETRTFNKIENQTEYTRTDLYTAACAERDEWRAIADGLAAQLELAHNGLKWWREEYPSRYSQADDEIDETIEQAITSYQAKKGEPTDGVSRPKVHCCKESLSGYCEYLIDIDPSWDECLHCHEPYERK